MPMKVALKVRLSASLPMADASPEAYQAAIKILRTLVDHAGDLGFIGIAESVTVSNVRTKADPTGGQSGEAQATGAAPGVAAVDEAERAGEFGPIPAGHKATTLRGGRGRLSLPA